MSSLFGLRQLSPKSFSRLQKEQRQGVEFVPRKTTPRASSESSSPSDGTVQSPPSEKRRRRPLVTLSSNPLSKQGSSRITLRKKIGSRGVWPPAPLPRATGSVESTQRTSSSTYSLEEEDVVQTLKQPSRTTAARLSRNHSVVSEECSPRIRTTMDENQSPTDLLLEEQILQLQQKCDEMSKSSSLHQHPTREWYQSLRDRLVSIQNDVHAVEAQRAELTQTAQSLQERRNELQHQLELREKELQTLSKRCAQQSEKLKSVHLMQASHSTLTKQVQEATASYEEQVQTVRNLETQLTATQAQKESLQEQLERLHKDYTAVTEQLETSLQQLQRLADEKQQWQAERGRLEQQLSWQKQQQEVEWMEERGNLQEQVASKDELIRILREEVTKLQTTEKAFEDEMHQMTVRHENELASRDEAQKQLVGQLEEQFADEMTNLLQQLQEEKQRFESEMEAMKEEHAAALQTEREQRLAAEAEVLKERQAGHELLRVQAEQHEQEEQALVAEFEKLLADEVETVRKEHDATVLELQNVLTEHKETIRQLSEQIESLQQANQMKLSTLQEARDETEKRLQEEHDTLVSELRATIAEHQNQIDSLIATARDEQARAMEELNNESASRIGEIQSVHQAALDRLQTDAMEAIQTLQKALQEQHARVEELEGSTQEWERRYRGQSDVYSRSVSQTKATTQQFNLRIEALEERIQQLTDENQDLTHAKENLQQHNDTLHQNIAEIQTKLDTEVAKYSADLETKVGDMEGTVQILSAKVEERTATIDTLEGELERAMQDLMVASSELESALEDSRLVQGLTSDLEALQLENAASAEALHERDVQIAELEAEILKLEMENEMERHQSVKAESANASRKATHAREVQSLRNYITELRRDLDQASRQLVDYRRLHSKSQSIVERLEEELRIANETAARDSTSSNETNSRQRREIERLRESHEMECKVLQDRVSLLEHDLSRAAKAHRVQLKAKENTINKLTEQLDEARGEVQKLASDGNAEYSLIRDQLHECRLELSRRDDELNALKCNTIPQLQSQIQELNNSQERYEQEVDTLESDKQILLKERNDLASSISQKATKSQAVMEQLHKTIESQKQELAEASRNLQCEQRKIESLEQNLNHALQRYEEAESGNARLSELEGLLDGMTREARLRDIETEEEKARTRELESALRQLRLDLAAQERRSDSLKTANEKTSQELEQLGDDFKVKTKQYGEALSKLNIANTELESCKQRLREAQSNADELEIRLAESKTESVRLSAALDEKDAECLATLEHERALRELSCEELADLMVKVEALQNEKQTNADLLKENSELKNKIRRQEAYLQRRLNKERIARQRNSINPEGARNDAPRLRHVKRSGSFSSHASGPKPVVPDVSLIDWDSSSIELDSLLAD